MRISSPIPRKKARIEIIPLIDIMFFLLVSFMLVSMSMIKMESIKMDLPFARQARRDLPVDMLNISVDKAGETWVEKKHVTAAELHAIVSKKFAIKTNVQVYISGDRDTTHGSMIRVLDLVRSEGIQKVSFAVRIPPPEKKQ